MKEIENRFPDTKIFLMGLLIVSGIFFALISYYFLVPIVLGIIFGIIFRPLYLWIRRKVKSNGLAVTLAVSAIVLLIIVPILLIMWVLFTDLKGLPESIVAFFEKNSINIDVATAWLNEILIKFNIDPITSADLANVIKQLGESLAKFSIQLLASIAMISFELITQLFVFFFVLSGVLMYAPEFKQYLVRVSPIDSKTSELFLSRTKVMSLMMTKGVFLIAIIQGALLSLLLWILAIIFTIIPVGAGIVTIPLAIVYFITGDYLIAIILILYTLIVITNLPNFLRPRLVKGKLNLRPSVILISILGGMAAFGFWGLIYGPVFMVIFITALETYSDLFKPKTINS
jgi:predicted PurR-regulated permease PerM